MERRIPIAGAVASLLAALVAIRVMRADSGVHPPPASVDAGAARRVDAGATRHVDAGAPRAVSVGSAAIPPPPAAQPDSTCADAQARRLRSMNEWLVRELARLAPKMTTSRRSKVITQRLAIVRDAYLAVYMSAPSALCAEAKGGRFEIVWTRFDGTIDADQEVDTVQGDDDASLRFFDFAVRAQATLRFRTKAGEEHDLPLELDGPSAFRFQMLEQGNAGAELTTTSGLAAGQGNGGPLVLLGVERGNVDVIDSNPRLTPESRIYVVRGGALLQEPPVPGAPRVIGLRDVDGDGRSDLLTPGPFEAMVPNVHGTPVRDHGPLLLAHATADGGYSMNDHVAVAHARRLCPKRPQSLTLPLDPKEKGVTVPAVPFYLTERRAEGFTRVVCARLWGVPRSALDAAELPDFLAAWATADVPLSLQAP